MENFNNRFDIQKQDFNHRFDIQQQDFNQRFEAFDELTYDNVRKVNQLLSTIYVDDLDPKTELPFKYYEELYPEYCTNQVSERNQYIMKNFEPLWINMLKLKLGQ